MMTEIPSFVVFFVGALGIFVLRGTARALWFIAVPLVSAAMLISSTGSGYELRSAVAGFDLILHRPDTLGLVFAYVFHLASALGAVFSWCYRSTTHQASALVYAGGAVGAVLCGDLISLFIFFEIMTFSAAMLVFDGKTRSSTGAAFRYLAIQIFAGLLLLVGAVMHYSATGSIEFTHIGLSDSASYLIFFAFGIKCAFPLVHNWVTDAYPESTPAGAIFMVALTTKVAVYSLARGFAGTESLVYIGAVMTCFPIFYAVIENDLRRVLAYSMINQIGFMVCGIGIGTELAVNGAVAHAFNHVIYKALLMMTMGAVLYRTGKINGSDLGGLYRSMPMTTGLCIVGAASISAFPLFSGFINKSMVMSAAIYEGYHIVWIALLFASAGVFHHAGIKVPFFAFFAHDSGIRCKEAPISMLIAMTVAAILCIGIGIFPELLYSILPYGTDYDPYDTSRVLAQIQLLVFSALAFVWLKLSGIYPPELRSTNIDAEWIYRRGARLIYRHASAMVSASIQACYARLIGSCRSTLNFAIGKYGESSNSAKTPHLGSMALFVFATLAGLLILMFV